ncbi:DUF1732 domain-containing protein [Myxococcota bacterium]|nr:DUF1732 domain-containing protein [Myxococcota bacterium]MBU1381233.1 DUF1732 domain-containing protein [Myxococcota bacterium]MBU1496932.1 DUF1732 domain-containing protein [Myxococcota bacterium]
MTVFSMTGYGKSRHSNNNSNILIEVKSLNSRFLDVKLKHPFADVEIDFLLREAVKKYLQRGRIEIFISVESPEKSHDSTTDLNELRVLSARENLGELRLEHLLLSRIADIQMQMITMERKALNPIDKEKLLENLGVALHALNEFRSREGEALTEVLKGHFKELAEHLETIENSSSQAPEKRFEVLKERAAKLISDTSEFNFEKELVALIDRMDISEEIIRLKTHFGALNELITHRGTGKEIEFITQELIREFNTISSKSPGTEVSPITVKCKNTVEKIKEIVANIE